MAVKRGVRGQRAYGPSAVNELPTRRLPPWCLQLQLEVEPQAGIACRMIGGSDRARGPTLPAGLRRYAQKKFEEIKLARADRRDRCGADYGCSRKALLLAPVVNFFLAPPSLGVCFHRLQLACPVGDRLGRTPRR